MKRPKNEIFSNGGDDSLVIRLRGLTRTRFIFFVIVECDRCGMIHEFVFPTVSRLASFSGVCPKVKKFVILDSMGLGWRFLCD